MIYCVVPRELAGKLHDSLRRHFRDDPNVAVVVERRIAERRQRVDRRSDAGDPPATERRLIKSASGRRIAEHRAAHVQLSGADTPTLPRRAERHASELVFVERVEPSTEAAEDADTARLVTRIQAGEQRLFAELYLRYFDRIYGYVRAILRDQHEAEDAVQQSFMAALEALPGYEIRVQPFRAWLFVLTRNQALKHIRKQRRVEVLEEAELDRHRELEPGTGGELPVLDWIADGELMMFVDRLPLAQRQVVMLRFSLGLSTREIAETLGSSEEAIRMQQSRALAFLRDRLAAVGRHAGHRQRSSARTLVRQARVVRLRRFSLSSPGPTG